MKFLCCPSGSAFLLFFFWLGWSGNVQAHSPASVPGSVDLTGDHVFFSGNENTLGSLRTEILITATDSSDSSNAAAQSFWFFDNDADGYGDSTIAVFDSAAPPGYVTVAGDCNDGDAAIYPLSPESCNGIDDDCSGIIDDNLMITEITTTWGASFGGTKNDVAMSIDRSLDGGYWLAGSTYSSDGDIQLLQGKSDLWVIRLNAGGQMMWQKTYGGSGDEVAHAVKATGDGGAIVVGPTTSYNGDVAGNHGIQDFWIVKLDSLGNAEWKKCVGGTAADIPYEVSLTHDGGYVIAGITYSGNGDVTGYHGGGDYWIIKTDSLGNLLWQKTYGGSAIDFVHALVASADGGYLVSGYARSADGDVLLNNGQEDMWILKLNSAGELLWQKSYGGTGGDGATSAVQTVDGGYALVGTTHSFNVDVTGNNGSHDFWVIKIDSAGTILWKNCLGGEEDDDATGLYYTADHGMIVTGASQSVEGEVSGHIGMKDYWVAKLDANGLIEWQQSFGGSKDDLANAIVQLQDGSFAVAGQSKSNDFEVTGNHGQYDVWVARFSSPSHATYFPDSDGDGYGDPDEPVVACSGSQGYVSNNLDCNDKDSTIHPASADVCNGIDDNCNAVVDDGAILSATITPLATVNICNTSVLTLECTSTAPEYTYQWLRTGMIIEGATDHSYAVSSAGVYSVTVSNGGCSSLSPATIVKLIEPSATVTPAGTSTVCSGSSVTFSIKGNPGVAYQWHNDFGPIAGATNQNYSASAAGNYFISQTDITGCTFNSSTSSLEVISAPNATVTLSGSTNICNTGSVIISVPQIQENSYQWYKDGLSISGSTTSSYTATVAGTYRVLVTTPNGCTKYSSSKTIKTCREEEISIEKNAATLDVYPNPATGEFTLELETGSAYSGPIKFELVNAMGELMDKKEVQVDSGKLSELIRLNGGVAPGWYLVRLKGEEGEFRVPLIISN
jgi:hypothetical protein